jgi:hypothetical protein
MALQKLADRLVRLQIWYLEEGFQRLRRTSETLLQLVYLYATAPAVPVAAALVEQQRSQLQNTTPARTARDTISALTNSHHRAGVR